MTRGALTVSVAMYSIVNVPVLSMHGASGAPRLDTSALIFSCIALNVNMYALSMAHVRVQYFSAHISSSVSDCTPRMHASGSMHAYKRHANPPTDPVGELTGGATRSG